MATEVCTGKNLISDKDLFARVSQCVAVGAIDEKRRLGGIAHLHASDDHKRILDEFFQEMINTASLVDYIYVAGGSNAFVEGFGFINGEKTAENVMNYLSLNFPKHETFKDIGGDFVRRLDVYTSMSYCTIKKMR